MAIRGWGWARAPYPGLSTAIGARAGTGASCCGCGKAELGNDFREKTVDLEQQTEQPNWFDRLIL
ncbi:hypothetical protein LOAG_14759 [Loa loa]|uniref:Uncharacterized protein n=1 Tax=Loa loa TaxID=7209 RepID=A0A1S0TH19_LOALO|nr:hypothetical protein LOAG_14759 [Loa loa]EFO13770.1 hypothetical protein LOAG_14759 [Loa loa]